MANSFPTITDKVELETTTTFAPKFDGNGLISAVVCDHVSQTVLMVGYMNEQSLTKTLETGEAHYWSRSRQELWHKGQTSGNVQKIKEIRTDCDQDALVLMVEVTGAAATCHTGKESCFYRIVEANENGAHLRDDGSKRHFDPKQVYQT